jgi:hypothetical protein
VEARRAEGRKGGRAEGRKGGTRGVSWVRELVKVGDRLRDDAVREV